MMKKKYLKIILAVYLTMVLILPQMVLAATDALNKLQSVGQAKGPYETATENTASIIIGTVINSLLALLGVVFLVLMLYAGYNWMIARGEEEKVNKAKDTITRALIGLIIVVGSYAIWNFVFSKMF